jgi:hypothetical protein
LPNNEDVTTFFGSGKILEGNTIIADGIEYIADESGNFASATTVKVDGLTSLYTGNLTDFRINLTNS